MNPFNATLVSIGFECCTLGVALFHFRKMLKRYFPVCIFLAVGSVVDLTSIALVYAGYNNSVSGNIYVLIELFIMVWLFKKLSNRQTNYFLMIVATTGIVLWILDNLILHSIYANNSFYRMGASALIVLMCLEKLGDITLFHGPDRVLRTDLLIISGLLVYYGFKTFIECFHVFQINVAKSFYVSFWVILAVIRIITYILFSLAILWTPKRTEYISHL